MKQETNKTSTFLKLALFNQRGNVDLSDGNSEEVSDSSDAPTDFSKYMDDASLEEMGAESKTTDEEPEKESLEGDKEPDLESQLKDFKIEAPEGEKTFNLLDEVNGLGVIRKGMPIEISDNDQLKEMLSKGFDYTEKTQELANLKTEQEDSFAKREQEFADRETKLQELEGGVSAEKLENNIIAQVLNELKVSDPDAHNELISSFQQKMNMASLQQNDPQIQGLKKELGDIKGLLQQNQQKNVETEDDVISKEWDEGLSTVQSEYGAKLSKLGIKPNWNEVSKKWAGDATGSLTVQEAFFAVHGDQLSKAFAAQSKLSQTRLKSAQRTGGTITDDSSDVKPKEENQFGVGNYLADLFKIAEKHA